VRLLDRITTFLTPEPDDSVSPFGRFEGGLLVVIAIGMTIMHFGGSEMTFLRLFGDSLRASAQADLDALGALAMATARSHPYYDLLGLVHWVVFCLIGYVLIPIIYLKACGRRVRDMYLGWSGFGQHLGLYFLLYLLVIVPVIYVSYSPAYQAIYPFYKHAGRSYFDLIAWELAYGIQFFALEFMFRGVFLAGLKKWLGYGAIYVMLIPYCMLHFMKTGSESLGAIVAGIILGTMAMKYRSIWGGVFLHWLVAITMDCLSLIHQGKMPKTLWPP